MTIFFCYDKCVFFCGHLIWEIFYPQMLITCGQTLTQLLDNSYPHAVIMCLIDFLLSYINLVYLFEMENIHEKELKAWNI